MKLPPFCLVLAVITSPGAEPFRIEIVEAGSGWPIPLVELRTTHHIRHVTDNAGVIACDAPELMGRETWFDVFSPGHEVPADGFGMRGIRLTPQPGASKRIEVRRTSIARRIGRLTGAGLFADSQRLGGETDWRESGIVGQDSVQTAVHKGRLYWFWGDTTLAKYPLGIFHGTGATTDIRALREFSPPLRLKLNYFTAGSGAPRAIATMPGKGPTWITGLCSLPDRAGSQRLVCAFTKINPPLDPYEWGLAVWDEAKEEFTKLRSVWTKSAATPAQPPVPEGHPVTWKDASGAKWLLFGNPFPTLRCRATFEAWQDSAQWEPLKAQDTLRGANGETVKPHSGSITWHPWRKKWVTVFMQAFGIPSAFGELWYAEAEAPTGPWGTAVKVLSHDNYTFYNPCLHIEFTPEGSSLLFFEGTYTQQFANKPVATPRYDYNQILYRLDLDDPALKPAQGN
jgi:hypothetical protein